MINLEDDVFVDLSTSCSQDVAVMKLLGWARGPILRRKILMTEDGISEDQMPFIPLNEISLAEQLMEMRAAASKDLIIAAEKGEPHDVLEDCEKAVLRYNELIRRAHEFSLDITDALNGEDQAPGDAPRLTLDQVKTQAEGVPYINLRSLDRWAQKKYGISIAATYSPTQADTPRLLAVEPSATGLTRYESLAVTFAFLVEAYAQKHPKTLLNADQKVIVSAMSEELAEIINKASQTKPPRGQGDEAIRKRITAALKVKDRKLRER